MTSKIFSSCFSLNFSNAEISQDYHNRTDSNFMKVSYLILIFMFLLSSGLSAFIMLYFWKVFELNILYKAIFYSTFVRAAIFLCMALIACFYSKKIKVKKLILYVYYFLFSYECWNARIIANRVMSYNTLNLFLLVVELIIRVLWLIIAEQSFM